MPFRGSTKQFMKILDAQIENEWRAARRTRPPNENLHPKFWQKRHVWWFSLLVNKLFRDQSFGPFRDRKGRFCR